MDSKRQSKGNTTTVDSAAGAGASAGVVSPVEVVAKPVVDPSVLDQASVFREAVHQTQPLAEPGSGLAEQAVKLVRNGSARHPLLADETARRLVTEGRDLQDLFRGRYPASKAAEVVVAHDLKAAHAGSDPGIVNRSPNTAPNVVDVRVSTDAQARRDILFLIEDKKHGLRFYRSGGQVKTGGNGYVSKTVAPLPDKLDYGQTAYVDAKYVNPDGSPRVGPGAFTEGQARMLQESKVRLRGIPDLESRAEALVENVVEHGRDGLDPLARRQLQQLRDDIARAYQPRGVAVRVAGGAAVAAATAALITLVVQVASGGEVDVTAVGNAAGKGALFGAGGALADAGIYHAATHLGIAPEAAKSLAQQGVAAGFCLIAVGADVFAEVKAARAGDVSAAGAVAGSSAKAALDILPFVLAPLGLVGVPILIGAQLGGRWAIGRVREADRKLELRIEEDLLQVAGLHTRLDSTDAKTADVQRECDETDEVFESVMSESGGHRLHLVTS